MRGRLGPAWAGALLLGGLGLLLWVLTRWGGGLPEALGRSLLPVLAAVVLGYLIGWSQQSAAPWSQREIVLTVGLGALGGLAALAWERFRPADLSGLSLLALLDAIFILPAILPAAVVPRPGAALMGLMVAQLRVLLPGVGGSYPALALLQVPLIVAPAELWLAARGRERSPLTVTIAGALVGLGSFLAAWLLLPGAYVAADWLGVLGGSLLAGAAAGWLVTRARARFGPGGAPPVEVDR
jgi:ABC-type thiamin/hydroxymethylpyrimidine transport system permease subunit